jgi:hypothetical protein
VLFAGFVLAVIAVAGSWLALSGGSRSGGSETLVARSPRAGVASSEVVAGAVRDLAGLPVPEGMTGVATPDGIVAGFVPSAALGIEAVDRQGGFGERLVLGGQQTDIRGVDVVDEKGQLVGYLIEPIGFIDLTTAGNVEAVRKQIEEHNVLEEKMLAEHPELQPK